jgi:hypothetical protein
MTSNEAVLRAALAIAGGFIVFTGLDFTVGGIASLGWQGTRPFFEITDVTAFHERDSHVRFLGGLWLGIGLIFAASAVKLRALTPVLLACIALIFLGGLARFTTGEPHVLFGPAIAGSLAAELIGMPVLFYWVGRVSAAQAR